MFDVCVVGHITEDLVKTTGGEIRKPGGTAYYTAIALKQLGMRVAVITKLRHGDHALLTEFKKEQIPVFPCDSPKTTTFMNIYPEDSGKREQWIKEIAAPFTIEEVSGVEAGVFHLGPLTRNDMPLDVIRFLKGRGGLSADLQGFVRDVTAGSGEWKKVAYSAWKGKKAVLACLDIVKANTEEARELSDKTTIGEIAMELSYGGPAEVIVTGGGNPSLVCSRGRIFRIPSYPPRNRSTDDFTGCGDTFMAGYLFAGKKKMGPEKAGKFSAMMVSLMLEQGDRFRASEWAVREFAHGVGEPF